MRAGLRTGLRSAGLCGADKSVSSLAVRFPALASICGNRLYRRYRLRYRTLGNRAGNRFR